MSPRTTVNTADDGGRGSFVVGSSSGTPPRRSARFALASPSPPATARRSPARLKEHVATQSPRRSLRITPPGTEEQDGDTGGRKRKSPDLHEDGIKKRLRVRCPAEPQPTPTRKGKVRVPSPDEAPKRVRVKQDTPRRPRMRTRSADANANGLTPAPAPVRVTRSSAAAAALDKMISPTPTKPLTLRSLTKGVRGRREGSPAPGRLDEIDMGVVTVSSPTPSPSLRLQIPVKKEPSSGGSSSSPCAPSSPIGWKGECESAADVDMPFVPPPIAITSAESPSSGVSNTTSARRDTRMRTRSLSPDDLAPSLFAPPPSFPSPSPPSLPASSAPSPSPTTSPSPTPSSSATAVPPTLIPSTTPILSSAASEGPPPPLSTDMDVDVAAGAFELPAHTHTSASPIPNPIPTPSPVVVVSPNWPLSHAPFSLGSYSHSHAPSPSPSPSPSHSHPHAHSSSSSHPNFVSPSAAAAYTNGYTRDVEWRALLVRRRRAGERALADADVDAVAGASSPSGGYEEPVCEGRAAGRGGVGLGSPLRRRVDLRFGDGEEEDEREGERERESGGEGGGEEEGEGAIALLPPPGSYEQQHPEEDANGGMAVGTGTGTGQSQSQEPASPGLSAGWGLWKIACRVRVWEMRNRYPPGLIRMRVAQEADEYFAARGIPHPDSLLFMQEEYYDWELDSEGEGDGEEDTDGDIDGDVDADLDAEGEGDGQGEFALQPPPTPPTPGTDAEGSPGMMGMGMGMGMGGVQSSFYATPVFSPPPLASVPVQILKNVLQDIAIAPLAGGRGTPVDRPRQAAWGGAAMVGDLDGRAAAGMGTGTLQRRLPHPRPRPHPMYFAMARQGYDTSEVAPQPASADGGEERRGIPM